MDENYKRALKKKKVHVQELWYLGTYKIKSSSLIQIIINRNPILIVAKVFSVMQTT